MTLPTGNRPRDLQEVVCAAAAMIGYIRARLSKREAIELVGFGFVEYTDRLAESLASEHFRSRDWKADQQEVAS